MLAAVVTRTYRSITFDNTKMHQYTPFTDKVRHIETGGGGGTCYAFVEIKFA